jgi:hypothetical protein
VRIVTTDPEGDDVWLSEASWIIVTLSAEEARLLAAGQQLEARGIVEQRVNVLIERGEP